MRDFENKGFVNFPQYEKSTKAVDCGKTLVYLVAIQEGIANTSIKKIGNFCGDDILSKQNRLSLSRTIEDVIQEINSQSEIQEIEKFYFQNERLEAVSSILIGWSKFTWQYVDRLNPWCCGFRDLSNEGKKIYYSLKKLHNHSDIRILTFNNIL